MYVFVVGYFINYFKLLFIYGIWLKCYGIEGSYCVVDVVLENFENFIVKFKLLLLEFVGGNIMIFYKECVFVFVDDVDEMVDYIGVVNMFWCEDGKLKVMNMDVYGFVVNFDEKSFGWESFEMVVVYGVGGVSCVVIVVFVQCGFCNVYVLNCMVERV